MNIQFSLRRPTGFRQTLSAALVGLGMAATVVGALLFQHVGGYIPCALCLEQRTPYYVAIPIGALALFTAIFRAPPLVTRGLLAVVGAVMFYAAYLGTFHAGVEWRLWAGPSDCGAVGSFDLSGDLLAQIDTIRPPSCDEAALRIFGLSLAGWNVVAATILAVVAARGAFKNADRVA